MRIIELRAENFKRLSAVRIKPDGSLVQITGRNAQGKSSVLDAIAAALGGKDAAPTKPVRKGTEKATVIVDLGDLKVTRRFTGDRSTLVVESPDGLKHPSPQAVLDKLVGRLSFDPLAFSRMEARDQARTLREVVGLDVSKLDEERARLFERRTNVNREVKTLQAQVAALPDVDAPDDEVSVAELAREHKVASDQRTANERERRRLRGLEEDVAQAKVDVEAAEQALADARAELEAAEKARAEAVAGAARLVDPDLDAISTRMQTAEETNAAVRSKKARAAKVEDLKKREAFAASLTKAIDEIDAKKVEALAAAKFPVEGLSVDGDVVTVNGVPFEQASSAEQIRVGLAIGGALNPKLRVVLVRDGSLLDADGLRLVAEWAEQHDMQVIMERVSDGSPVGIVIEDGEVAGAEHERGADDAA
jgi:DNA repair ATPase RecN